MEPMITAVVGRISFFVKWLRKEAPFSGVKSWIPIITLARPMTMVPVPTEISSPPEALLR